MFRLISNRLGHAVTSMTRCQIQRTALVAGGVRNMSHGVEESDEEFDARYEAYFNRPDIDGWDLRKGMNDLMAYDLVPEPKIVVAAMKACRRVDDYALAVRYLEAVKDKCGPRVTTIWPYMLNQIQPTLEELGILTPEQMGYDKPELALQDVMDIH